MGAPTPAEFQQLLDLEAGRLSEVDKQSLDLAIPHIEGWTVKSVVGHTGWVLRYASTALRADPANPPSRSSVAEPPPGAEVLDWYRESVAMVQETLADVDLNTMVPTFTGPQPASWWSRRLAHEVSVHRWDAQSVTDSPDQIDGTQAVDGIDEILQIFVPLRLLFDTLKGSGETMHLHATDEETGEWFMTFKPDSIDWERSHTKGDVAARATASDLFLLMWGRIDPSAVDVIGEVDLLDRWQAAAKF